MEIKGKPDFEESMRRIEAWFNHEPLDRPPVRFSQHNSDYADLPAFEGRSWPNLKARWFDAEFQVTQSKQNRPFARVSKDGKLVPEVVQVIGIIAKNNLVLE